MEKIKYRIFRRNSFTGKYGKENADDFAINSDGELLCFDSGDGGYHIVKDALSHWVISLSTRCFDKNENEIFDGDIVRHEFATGEDFVSNGIMVVGDETPDGQKIIGLEMFDPKCSTTFSFDASKEIQDDVEIIGNIYENPELLCPTTN